MDDLTAAFFEAAEAFSALIDDPAVARAWSGPSALEGYTVGGVVGHVNVAVGWLVPLLDTAEPAGARPIRPGRYYTGMKLDPAAGARDPMHDVVRDMSEQTGARGPEANATQFGALLETLRKRLPDERDDRLLDLHPVVPACARLDDFVKTRIVELVVHADDLAVSVGATPATLSEAAAGAAIDALVTTARAAHGDIAVLRALTRRERSSDDVFPVF